MEKGKMIKVKMLINQAGPSVLYKKGGEYELPEAKALRLIKGKAAEPVDKVAFDKAYSAETAKKKTNSAETAKK